MNITELLTDLGIPFARGGTHRHVTANFVGVDCPWCSPGEGKFKLGIPVDGHGCSCWTCGPRPLADALIELTGRPWREVKRLLDPLELEAHQRQPEKRGKVKLPPGVGPMQEPHRRYLKGRGFDPDELERLWGLQGIGVARRLPWRLFVPVHDAVQSSMYQPAIASWTTRSISMSQRDGFRWLSARPDEEAVPLKTMLYGESLCRHAAIVVEGPSDAWRVGPGAVATFGLAATRQQVLRLTRFPIRVVAFDHEPKAQRAAERLCWLLEGFPGTTMRVELGAADPGCASKEEITELRKRFLE